MDIERIASVAINVGFRVHKGLGPGLLESAYQAVMVELLVAEGLAVEQEKIIPIHFEGLVIDKGFRADIIVEGKLLLELKSIEKLAPIHGKQVLTYLRLSNLSLGLLMNFGGEMFKDGLRRIVNGHDDGRANMLHREHEQPPSRA